VDGVPDSVTVRGSPAYCARLAFLLFATSPGVLFLATNATHPANLFAPSLYILSFVFTLIGLGVAVDGFRGMTRHQP